MKRFQRIFLSLLAIFAVWFSMANAYTFEVRNRSPFGILNLKTLNLKPDTTHTGIILDWANYVIKIDPNHESTWAIRVDAICDESWANCKKVSELWIWGWSSITIKGDPDNFCYMQDETTLVCNNTALRELIEKWWLGWGGNANDPTITIYQWWVEKWSFTLNQSSNTGIYLDAGGDGNANNPTITIRQWWVTKWSFTLNQASNKTIDLDAGWNGNANNPTITIYQWGVEKWKFTLNQASDKTIQLTDANTWTQNTKVTDGFVTAPSTSENLKCWKTDINGNPWRGSCWWGWDWITLITWQNNMYCKYIEANDGKWGTTKWIQCTYDAWSSTSPTWSWDSLWTSGTRWISTKDTKDVYFDGNNVSYKNSLSFFWYDGSSAFKNRTLYLDSAWARIGSYAYTWVWLGVVGAIWLWNFQAWCDTNRITMFASWSTQTWNFEILGNNRLLVGTKNDSYIYFNLWNTVWINTTGTAGSTLSIKWSVKVWNCGKATTRVWTIYYATCDETTIWQIRYVDTTNPWQFVWCIKDGSNYKWVSLSYGNNEVSNFRNTTDCTASIPYSQENYSSIWYNLTQQCSN